MAEVAYGFVGLRHLWAERVQQLDQNVFYDAINESAAFHTQQIDSLTGALVEQTTERAERFYLPGGGTLQPLDDYGNPLPTRPAGFYDVGYPIRGGGDAFGDNRVARALMTVEEANRRMVEMTNKDADWNVRGILKALLFNEAWTFERGNEPATVVQPLANGDEVTYQRSNGAARTADHYQAQSAAISEGDNPFPWIHRTLSQYPSNGTQVVVYVAPDLVPDITGLDNFVVAADPDVSPALGESQLTGSLSEGFGDEVVGKVDRCWIVEWSRLPEGYMFAHARGSGTVLRRREYPTPALQGFFPELHSPDGNLQEMRMLRYAGYGVRNRIGALAYQVGAAEYQAPEGFDARQAA